MKLMKKIIFLLGLLAVLSPLGLIIPEHLGAGSAWGEWSKEELHNMTRNVPSGFLKLNGSWEAPLPDYNIPRHHQKQNISYIISAVVGMLTAGILLYGIGRVLIRNEKAFSKDKTHDS